MEISSYENSNINELFETLAQQIIKIKQDTTENDIIDLKNGKQNKKSKCKSC